MNLNEYQRLAQRTANTGRPSAKLENGILGLCGELGEIADIWKKYMYQGHEFDFDHAIREAGDILWYIAELAAGLGCTLEDIAQINIDKLRTRYPDGFDAEKSMHRQEGDV